MLNKRKHSQVFLIKIEIIELLIKFMKCTNYIVEAGSGYGNLTDFLIRRCEKIYIIEIDKKICFYLKNKYSKIKKIKVINNDLLKTNINFFNKKITMISSIPYHLINKFINFFIKNKYIFKYLNIIIPYKFYTKKIYNKNNFYYYLFRYNFLEIKRIIISKNSFYPKPKIDSILLVLKIRNNKNIIFENFFNMNINFYYNIKRYFYFKIFNKIKKIELDELLIIFIYVFKFNKIIK
ncbi:rRNA adenine N-6-methyltransferase family protein [Candidatus Vidania fulgoroideorum]